MELSYVPRKNVEKVKLFAKRLKNTVLYGMIYMCIKLTGVITNPQNFNSQITPIHFKTQNEHFQHVK